MVTATHTNPPHPPGRLEITTMANPTPELPAPRLWVNDAGELVEERPAELDVADRQMQAALELADYISDGDPDLRAALNNAAKRHADRENWRPDPTGLRFALDEVLDNYIGLRAALDEVLADHINDQPEDGAA